MAYSYEKGSGSYQMTLTMTLQGLMKLYFFPCNMADGAEAFGDKVAMSHILTFQNFGPHFSG